MLIMGQNLDFLKIRLTCTLSDDALVLTARAVGQVSHGRVVLGHWWKLVRLVVLNLEVEDLQRVENVQIVKVSRRVGFNLLQERRDIGLILQRQLKHGLAD